MSRSNRNLTAIFQDTADAIRNKKGTSNEINPRDFADEIDSIETGGGEYSEGSLYGYMEEFGLIEAQQPEPGDRKSVV